MQNIGEPSLEDIIRHGGNGQQRQGESMLDMFANHNRSRQSRSLMDNPNMASLVVSAMVFGEDESTNGLIREGINRQWLSDTFGEWSFRRPDAARIRGEYLLGFCQETDAPVGINPDEVHFLVCAASGKGKTSLFKNLIRQHIDAGERILAFDFENEYRHVLNDSRINYLGLDDLKFNPLEVPPGMKPSRYRQMFCAVLSDVLGLLVGSKSYLNNTIKRLYQIYGVNDGGNTYPSLFELADLLVERMSNTKSNTREYSYLETCLNRIQGFIDAFEDVVDCSSGMPFHVLTESNLVVELHGADFEYQSLMVNLMLVWLCCYRISNGLRNNPEHNLAVFIDEAQRLFDIQQERRPYQGVPTISHLVATVRKYNLKLFVAAQQPSLLASSIAANAFAKLQMPLGHGNDIMSMSTSQFLDEDQTRYARLLGTGEAIVKLSDRWTEPFVIRIPYEE
ncbi:ATP-binding protein [Candidatus Poribacteria bacterium]